MELKDFIKTKATQKFIQVNYVQLYTKQQILAEVQEVVEKWVADGLPEKEIKERVGFKVNEFEPYTKEFKSKVNGLMKKWGLK